MAAPSLSFGSYEEVLQLYHDYINGKVATCPTRSGSIEDALIGISAQQAEHLVLALTTLNQKRWLAVDFQLGINELNHRQRAHVEAYLPADMWSCINDALTLSDFVYFTQKIKDFRDLKLCFCHPQYPVSLYRQGEGTSFITVGNVCPMKDIDDFLLLMGSTASGVVSKLKNDLVWVLIVDPLWGRNTLFERLIGILVANGLLSPKE